MPSRIPPFAVRRKLYAVGFAAVAAPLLLGACVAGGPVAALAPEPERIAATEPISGSARIDQLINRYADEYGVPRALAYGVIRVESRYNPHAKGRGVYGLSQIMPATARSMGFSGPASALFDPAVNLKYGMRYLKGAWEKGGHDVCRASMKYKGGHRATRMTQSALNYCAAVKKHIREIGMEVPGPQTVMVAESTSSAEGSTITATVQAGFPVPVAAPRD